MRRERGIGRLAKPAIALCLCRCLKSMLEFPESTTAFLGSQDDDSSRQTHPWFFGPPLCLYLKVRCNLGNFQNRRAKLLLLKWNAHVKRSPMVPSIQAQKSISSQVLTCHRSASVQSYVRGKQILVVVYAPSRWLYFLKLTPKNKRTHMGKLAFSHFAVSGD